MMLLSLKEIKNKQTNTKQQKQQQHVIAPVYIIGGDTVSKLL